MTDHPEWPQDICDLPVEQPDRYVMSDWEDVCLQVGWIVLCVLLLAVFAAYNALADRIAYDWKGESLLEYDEKDDTPSPRSQNRITLANPVHSSHKAYLALWGEPDQPHTLIESLTQGLILFLSLLNFYVFAAMTEAVVRPETAGQFPGESLSQAYHQVGTFTAAHLNYTIEYPSWFIFLGISVLRLMYVKEHPDWIQYGSSASWRYALSDTYMLLELVALIWTLIDLIIRLATGEHTHVNLLWFFFARSMEMVQRSGAGIGLSRLSQMVSKNGKLLGVSWMIGMVIWLIMSGCYFAANRTYTEDGGVWCAYVRLKPWKDEDGTVIRSPMPWGKFDSIPSSMWFVLINLVKEHPFADAHVTFWQRFFVCIVCILAMPLFGLPTAVLQSSLVEIEDEEGEEDQEGEKEEIVDPAKECRSWRFHATWILTIWSVVTFFYYTARDMPHSTIFFRHLRIESQNIWAIDTVVGLLFFAEYIEFCAKGGLKYALSGLGIIDACSWMFAFVHTIAFFADMDTEGEAYQLICAACVLRMLKFERYIGSFRLLRSVCWKNMYMFLAAMVLAMFMWMFFSTVLYLTERYNYDKEMVEQYGSVMRSLWAELINLHGEWPWGDYSTFGKAWCTLIALIAIMLFCIPISVFQASMEELVLLDMQRDDDEQLDRAYWQQHVRPDPEHLIANWLHEVFYAHLYVVRKERPRGYWMLRGTAVAMVTINIMVTLFLTVPPHRDMFATRLDRISYSFLGTGWDVFFYFLDLMTCAFFTFELVARILATQFWHLGSFTGFCDALSLVALYVTLTPVRGRSDIFLAGFETEEWFDDGLGLLRLLRIFSLESYWSCFHVIRKVCYSARRPLLKTGCATVTMWFLHATLLWLVERPRPDDAGEEDEDEVTMRHRYSDVLRALQYSIVHLFGDYPECDYLLPSKIIHFVGIMCGIAILSAFCGVFTASFVAYVREDRKAELADRALTRLCAAIRVAKRMSRVYRQRKIRQFMPGYVPPALPPPPSQWMTFSREVVLLSTPRGRNIALAFNVTLIFNLVMTLFGSMPMIDYSRYQHWENLFTTLELMASCVFAFEYACQITAGPLGSWRSFRRIVDFICIFPGFIHTIVEVSQKDGMARTELEGCIESAAEALMIIRSIRLLFWQYWQREMVVITRALDDSKGLLAQPAYLALCTWVVTSALFMWVEQFSAAHYTDNIGDIVWEEAAANFNSVPDTMYWCCIFLTGEWANVDFSFMGSRLSIFYVFFGITFFSIPCAIIVESVQANLEWVHREEELYAVGSGNGKERRSKRKSSKKNRNQNAVEIELMQTMTATRSLVQNESQTVTAKRSLVKETTATSKTDDFGIRRTEDLGNQGTGGRRTDDFGIRRTEDFGIEGPPQAPLLQQTDSPPYFT